MIDKISEWIDRLSDYFALRKGLLPMIGMVLILVNLVLQIFPLGWISTSNLFLHIGLLVALAGMLLAWAL